MELRTVILIFLTTALCYSSCKHKEPFTIIQTPDHKQAQSGPLFVEVSQSSTGIKFQNNILETDELNFINYSNIYNGGGLATADFNNDNLADIFFVANQEANKLFLNKGSFTFDDISSTSGITDEEGWSTGVSIIDINNDGWLDIYVCKSGEVNDPEARANRLFINQHNNQFIDQASKWNVDDKGYGTQSYFLDYDKDGDLDIYLVNHRVDFDNAGKLNREAEIAFSEYTSDKLYRNDNSVFTDVTKEANVLNHTWGLSAVIGDFNHDNWPDVYVCNDFYTPDILYVNNKNGTFSNEIQDRMGHISYSSMGSDYADINNDLLPDLMVVEMASEDHIRSKTNMASMNTKAFNRLVELKYHRQYMLNTLQLNTQHGRYSDIAQLAGVAKTDWSWAPLFGDYDNDGFKDIFITNGIFKEMGDQDSRSTLKKIFSNNNEPNYADLIDILPSYHLTNYGFKNNGNYTFTNATQEWGLNAKTQSNGVAYADLDNDGDLDIVINNINDSAQVYKNGSSGNFIQLRLKGTKLNPNAIGSQVIIKTAKGQQHQDLYLSRGFLSSVQGIMNFGIGDEDIINEIRVVWPNGSEEILKDISANQILEIKQVNTGSNKEVNYSFLPEYSPNLNSIRPHEIGINFKHKENKFDDYKNQILLPYGQSTNGPFIDKSDVNGDGRQDFFVGGASGQAGSLFLQDSIGRFKKDNSAVWKQDKSYEDLGVLFFDYDGDEDDDLYVVSGGSEFDYLSEQFNDRLYINDGNGSYEKSNHVIPELRNSAQCVKASDIDNDGDLDLFVGGRVIPDKYPFSPQSYILLNENGKFLNRTDSHSQGLNEVGMVTDAVFSDYDNDGDQDLIVVGEWMPISIFENINGVLKLSANNSLEHTKGIWFSIAANDIDNDGDEDYFIGNLGLNTKFKASTNKPFQVFCDDYDGSGTYDIVLSGHYQGEIVPYRGRECSSQQMPFIKDKFPSYMSFAKANVGHILGTRQINDGLQLKTELLQSIFLRNLGNGSFEIVNLPNLAQVAPIMDFEFLDIDNDQREEIIIVGNHYNVEVETVRYDASQGIILSYQDGEFHVKDAAETGFYSVGNAKDIMTIDAAESQYLLVANNNDYLNCHKLVKL